MDFTFDLTLNYVLNNFFNKLRLIMEIVDNLTVPVKTKRQRLDVLILGHRDSLPYKCGGGSIAAKIYHQCIKEMVFFILYVRR